MGWFYDNFGLYAPLSLNESSLINTISKRRTLTALDIGARGGFDQFLRPIRSAVRFVGFEPDQTEATHLNNILETQKEWKRAEVIPIALSDKAGEETLFITRDLGSSSLLEPNWGTTDIYGRNHLFDKTGEVSVRCSTLDQASERHCLQDSSYLKIDVQGAELKIVKGGTQLIRNSIVALRIEINFVELYHGQPTFGQMDEFMNDSGLFLTSFHQPIHWSRLTQLPISRKMPASQSCGDLAHADAIYLKRMDILEAKSSSEPDKCIDAALLALCYGKVPYALKIIEFKPVKDHLERTYGLSVDRLSNEILNSYRCFDKKRRFGNNMRNLYEDLRW